MKMRYPLLATTIIVLLAGWGSEAPKNEMIFFGTLYTQQGHAQKIKNIEFIPDKRVTLYEMPAANKGSYTKTTNKENNNNDINNNNKIILHIDPKKDLTMDYAKLSKDVEIRIPHPKEIWTYQKDTKSRLTEYIEIIVTRTAGCKTEKNYLINRETEVRCKAWNDPVEADGKKIPLTAIDRLVIEGYYSKEDEQQQACVQQQVCMREQSDRQQDMVTTSTQEPQPQSLPQEQQTQPQL
jgi:hypothetical protein